jgi:hypothetical protein
MGRRVGWSEMIADTWRQDAMDRPEEFLSQHWSNRLIDTPLLLAIEVENHLENAEKYGAEKERQRIIDKLDKYTMYRFEKQWMIDLIEEDDEH